MPEKKTPKRKLSFKKIFKLIFIFIIIIGFVTFVWKTFFVNEDPITVAQETSLEQISSTEIDQTLERATAVAQAFTVDFYTLKYKESRAEVGGLEYVWNNEEFYTQFITAAQTSYYKDIEFLIDEYGSDKLPEVTSAEVSTYEETTDFCSVTYDTCFESTYEFVMDITYKNNDLTSTLQPPTNITITVAWDGSDYKVLYVE